MHPIRVAGTTACLALACLAAACGADEPGTDGTPADQTQTARSEPVNQAPFGVTPDGQQVTLYTLTNANGSETIEIRTLITYDVNDGHYKSWTFLSTGSALDRAGETKEPAALLADGEEAIAPREVASGVGEAVTPP